MATATKSRARKPPPKPLLELKVNVEPGGSAEATIPVAWCVSPELTAKLVEMRITKPHLLILVRPYRLVRDGDDQETERRYFEPTKRYVVPLKQGMQYVSFSKPGLNRVSAYLIYNLNGRSAWHINGAITYSRLLDYRKEVREGMGEEGALDLCDDDFDATALTKIHDDFDVEVPAEMFGTPPPEWKKTYLAKFFFFRPKKAFDECTVGRRWWGFGVWFMPIWLITTYLLRIGSLIVGAWLGLRDMRLSAFRHPLDTGTNEVIEYAGRSVWFFDSSGGRLPFWRWLLNPISPVVLATAVVWISRVPTVHHHRVKHLYSIGWWKAVLIIAGLQLAVVAACGVLAVMMVALAAITSLFAGKQKPASKRYARALRKQQRKDAERAREIKERELQLQQLRNELATLNCENIPATVSVDALPKERRLVRLRIQQYKTKHCRPYAS